MQVIPVFDLQDGVVVRGVAGKRDSYRRIRSSLTDSCDPSVILNIFATDFECTRCYIADLDAIQHQQLNRCTIAELSQSDVRLLVDRGVRGADDVEELFDLDVAEVVVALETLPDIATAETLLRQFDRERLVLSFDMLSGRVLTTVPEFADKPPDVLVNELLDVGFENIIVLDLAAVGMESGTPTVPLCQTLRAAHPKLQISTGGGIQSMDDLRTLEAADVDGALVASALHNGRITPDEIRRFRKGFPARN